MVPEKALQDLEYSVRVLVSIGCEIAEERIEVKLANEERDGNPGIRLDVLVDGTPHAQGEKIGVGVLMAANEAVAILISREAGVS